ncbi:low temperature requirement protein A [Frankia gtarii]|uniref:low temperature requirement protein A n=1 Tax=Frankia gtarii TaxID=2950102 RepID=UPI0021C142D4|nr:low temperature requirement protein A [Frankia gtarii]
MAYFTVFFAVWWAWMNFTHLATSAYDVDDVPDRVATFVQIAGVLILAAGVPRAFDDDFTVVTLGYAMFRCGLVTQWLRAARGADGWHLLGFAVMAPSELAVPIIAERAGRTPWHPHIAERYGLFAIIVLGESILSAMVAVQPAIDYFSFAAAAAVGADLTANIDRVAHHGEIDRFAASAAVTVPVAVFLVTVALLRTYAAQ